MVAPTIAAITVDPTGGGIAAVARLFWRVIREQWAPHARLVTMFDHESRPATFGEKARYTVSMTSAQMFGRTDWILFTHLGLAKIQKSVPARFRRPYGVFLHGIEAWKPFTTTEHDAVAGAQLRIANSRYTADRVTAAHPSIGAIAVCPLALAPRTEATRATRLLRPVGAHAVLAVGRMSRSERYKGHDQLIESWPQVLAKVHDAQLIIAGDGDDAPRLKEKAAAGPAGRQIQFTGFVSKAMLDALYQAAALFALPSRAEGFGVVYLEAMAHRLPCIGSIHDAAREVIVDGQTGRLVDQDDAECLAEAIATLLLDDERRRRMGEAGYRRLVSDFSFDRFEDRVCNLLHADRPAAVSAAV
jgi:phosphatidylinositol alpha-1,6-mannosyltransferase